MLNMLNYPRSGQRENGLWFLKDRQALVESLLTGRIRVKWLGEISLTVISSYKMCPARIVSDGGPTVLLPLLLSWFGPPFLRQGKCYVCQHQFSEAGLTHSCRQIRFEAEQKNNEQNITCPVIRENISGENISCKVCSVPLLATTCSG